MSDFKTVNAITDNLETVLKAEVGINFERASDETDDIPASEYPLGQLFYKGETFEYNHGQKPGYAESEFTIRLSANSPHPRELMREIQRLVHKSRDALTVNALNIGELETSKLVSLVVIDEAADTEYTKDTAETDLKTLVRYRET